MPRTTAAIKDHGHMLLPASDASSYHTGTVIHVDGGPSIARAWKFAAADQTSHGAGATRTAWPVRKNGRS